VESTVVSAKVISFINYKGGVGKTTTTYHVGCSLADHHAKKVLLIDIDPQTNLTFLCAPFEKWKEFKGKQGTIATLYGRFRDKKALDTKRCVWHEPIRVGRVGLSGLDLIPCDVDLLGEDVGGAVLTGAFPTMEALKRHADEFLRERSFLSRVIREVEDRYDYILIDCPPNLYLMTQNALVASPRYVITAIPDHLSTIGLSILRDKVNRMGELIVSAHTFGGRAKPTHPIAELGGVIFVKVRIGGSMITNTHFSTMKQVERLLGTGSCFSTHTTELIGFSEAAENSLPVWRMASQNAERAAHKAEYQEITNEVLRRF
jgi:chromosome partitioning protein